MMRQGPSVIDFAAIHFIGLGNLAAEAPFIPFLQTDIKRQLPEQADVDFKAVVYLVR